MLVRRVRSVLRRVPGLRYLWNIMYSVGYAAFDPWRHATRYDKVFVERVDPFQYTRAFEQERHRIALGMIRARVRCGASTVLEIGCAEGMFTKHLAMCAEVVLAIDYSETAIRRARAAVDNVNVAFRVADLRGSIPAGQFNVVIVMDVLSSFGRPWMMRRALRRLRERVADGGYLLVSDVRLDPSFERSWWCRLFLRGGWAIVNEAVHARGWVPQDLVVTDTHVIGVAQRLHSPQSSR